MNDEFKRAWGKDFRSWEGWTWTEKRGCTRRVRRRVTIWIPGLLVVIGINRDEETMRLALMVLRERGVNL